MFISLLISSLRPKMVAPSAVRALPTYSRVQAEALLISRQNTIIRARAVPNGFFIEDFISVRFLS